VQATETLYALPRFERGRAPMRWFLRLALVALVVGLAIPVATARAATTVETMPFEATFTACGETISLSGTLLGVFTVQEVGGGEHLGTFHLQLQGVSGLSSSGIRYHATGLTFGQIAYTAGLGYTNTYVLRFLIVGTMGFPTWSVTETAHITVTPSGDVTAYFDNLSLECV
jgi:hypothetical protein